MQPVHQNKVRGKRLIQKVAIILNLLIEFVLAQRVYGQHLRQLMHMYSCIKTSRSSCIAEVYIFDNTCFLETDEEE